MHKVLNFGSVLQAYALQRIIMELGYDCEIIDYLYPPQKDLGRIRRFWLGLIDMLIGSPRKKKTRNFSIFYDKFLFLSSEKYDDMKILKDPPQYDVYIVGSDQVWNPRFCKDKTAFLLGFVPDGKRRIAYSSSFATSLLPEELEPKYSYYLNKFDSITVRERSGCSLVNKLTSKDAFVVCDPTILLKKEQWMGLITPNENAKPYILVYIMSYMFYPYPSINMIVKEVQNKLGLRVIYLEASKHQLFKHNSEMYKGGGPLDFLNMIANASFVVTTSFHGAAFSAIMGLPFIGVVEGNYHKDDRISSLLNLLDCSKSLIVYNKPFVLDETNIDDYRCKADVIEEYRKYSIEKLSEMLKKSNTLNA